MAKIPPTRKQPQIDAPAYHSCTACYKGDTETVMLTRGEAEFHMAVLAQYADMSLNEATATITYFCRVEMGCQPGMIPDGVFTAGFRLCEECAAKTGAHVAVLVDGEMIAYIQPEHMTLGYMTAKEKRDFFRDINAYLRTFDPGDAE
jgi:hypothetical protein